MDDQKIGLTIYLLKEDQVPAFRKELFGERQLSIPLSEPLDGTFFPFPPGDGRQPNWVPERHWQRAKSDYLQPMLYL